MGKWEVMAFLERRKFPGIRLYNCMNKTIEAYSVKTGILRHVNYFSIKNEESDK